MALSAEDFGLMAGDAQMRIERKADHATEKADLP
jgi:hypothetical protein